MGGDVALIWLEPKDYTLQNAQATNDNGTAAALGGKYASLTLQILPSTGPNFAGAVNFEASLDGKNYVPLFGDNGQTTASSATTGGIWTFRINGIFWFRARTSGVTGGNVTVIATAVAVPDSGGGVQVTGSLPQGSNTIGFVNLKNSGNGNEPLIGNPGDALGLASMMYVAAFLEAFNGTTSERLRTVPGATGILGTPASGTQSVGITTITTTALKASAGVLGTISNAGAAVSGTITVYDNTSASGKKVWSGTVNAGEAKQLGIPCGTGITIVTAAADTLAVTYA